MTRRDIRTEIWPRRTMGLLEFLSERCTTTEAASLQETWETESLLRTLLPGLQDARTAGCTQPAKPFVYSIRLPIPGEDER